MEEGGLCIALEKLKAAADSVDGTDAAGAPSGERDRPATTAGGGGGTIGVGDAGFDPAKAPVATGSVEVQARM